MMKSLYEELGGTYTLADDGMYYPNITLVENEHCLIGRWGRMHRAWLEAELPGLYELLILNGTLFRHLADADERVGKMSEQLTAQLIKHEGITEALNAVSASPCFLAGFPDSWPAGLRTA